MGEKTRDRQWDSRQGTGSGREDKRQAVGEKTRDWQWERRQETGSGTVDKGHAVRQ